MKSILINFFLILVFNVSLFAQNIYFCNSHTEDGLPIDADIVWDIRPLGEDIYILFDNNDQPISEPILYLLIDKLDDSKYQPFDSRAIHLQKNNSWVAQNYRLTQPGEYEVYIMGSNRERLATARMTVNVKTNNAKRNGSSDLYYDDCEMVFCQLVVAGKPLNIRTTISMTDGASTYIYLKCKRPFNTSKLIINIWRKRNRAFEYDEFVDTKKYKMNSTWPDVFFTYKFNQPGEYRVSVYNEKENLIKFGFITVSE